MKNKTEKIFAGLIIIILLLIPVFCVYTKAMLSKTNIELEKLKSNIYNQKNINNSLKMEISELASLDKIQDVVSAEGLVYQNDNIKVIAN